MGTGRGVEEGGPPGMKAKILVNPTPYDAAPPPPAKKFLAAEGGRKIFLPLFLSKSPPGS